MLIKPTILALAAALHTSFSSPTEIKPDDCTSPQTPVILVSSVGENLIDAKITKPFASTYIHEVAKSSTECQITQDPNNHEFDNAQVLSQKTSFAGVLSSVVVSRPEASASADYQLTTENIQESTQADLDADLIFSLVNNYRLTLNLKAFTKDERLCSIASGRRNQLTSEINGQRPLHAGFKELNLQFRSSENMIHIRSEVAALNWWLASPVHRASIESDYAQSCVACQGKSCVQIFATLPPVDQSL